MHDPLEAWISIAETDFELAQEVRKLIRERLGLG